MVNPAGNIRAGFYSALNGAVSYDGSGVPVYEGVGDENEQYQILIGDQLGTIEKVSHRTATVWRQTIEVVALQFNTDARRIVDEIGNNAMGILAPFGVAPATFSVTGFQVYSFWLSDISHLIDTSGMGEYVVRLKLSYEIKIQQTT